MRDVVLHMLPFAVGIAISPVPIITVILMLFTPRPKSNGAGFLLGWFLGIGLPALVVFMLDRMINQGNDASPPSRIASTLRIAFGFLLILVATWNWVKRNKPDDENKKPLLMKVVDSITPWKAILLGFLFADVTNPKNLALTVAGCLAIAGGHLTALGNIFSLTLFTGMASLGVAIPVLLFMSGGEKAKQTVEQWRQWLMKHKKGVMAVLFFVFGVALLVKGLNILA
jgi:cytochrome c biogenesis protein CcdA